MKISPITAGALALLAIPRLALGYPMDAYEQTGILRLEAYRLAQTGEVKGRILPPGGRLGIDDVQLRLTDYPDFEIPAPDSELSASILEMLGEDADGYAISVLDITDPAKPRYAAHNPEQNQNPGSVGKLMVGEGVEGVPVNQVIAVLLEEGEDATAIDSGAMANAPPPAEPTRPTRRR